MDAPTPRTRKETKKSQKEKARGTTIYSAKHVRQIEALAEKKLTRGLAVR
jgi:hypothetical protein